MIYLDYNATAPIKPAVRAAMIEAMDRGGNPSSVHRYGRSARKYVEQARAQVAALVGVKAAQVIFTSGGTEANNLALTGLKVASYAVSAIEHDSVLAVQQQAVRLPVTSNGINDLTAAEHLLAALPAPGLVSVMLANNETGVIQPIVEIIAIAKKFGHLVHCDAVQALGRLPLDFTSLGIDSLSISAHKIAGPQGMGALIVREGLPLQPLLAGGGQEQRRRAGTENVAGIIGFGVAAQLAADDLRHMPQLRLWRDYLETSLLAIAGDEAIVLGQNAPRLANTLCIALKEISSETQVMAMDLAGVAVSAGSACSSGKVKASHVLQAMTQADSVVGCGLRISLGWNTQISDIERCVQAWRGLYLQTRRDGPLQSVAA